jgi:signal transduction histidine kinase
MMRSLSARLVLALLIILVSVGLVFTWLAKWSSDRYHQEITQRLNSSIAMYIVNERPLLDGAAVNSAALEHVAHMAMVVNPVAEVYLLDPQGNILGHALPPAEVSATQVDTGPIQHYLSGAARPPIRGDDPRNTGEKKVFSVSPIEVDGNLAGYVYVVLGGARYESEAQRVLDSHILRISVMATAAIVLVSAVVGLLVFSFLTRRLRRLAGALNDFEASGFHEPISDARIGASRKRGGDEIDTLSATFHEMSSTIVDQISRLETTDLTRRELIANVSHDLRTPIASMTGYLDTLLMKHDSLPADQRQRYLEVASKHGAYLAKLVEDLFELSCLDSGLIKPATETFSLSELVQDVAQKYQLQAAQARVTLEPHVDAGVPLVDADIGMIQQVLENLIANALRHTPPRGNISVTVTPAGDSVKTVVADTGEGISSNDLPHIFNRAYSGGHTATNNRANTGLGLAIVKRILDLHHAHIGVTSREGEGSAFRFELPIARVV